MLYKNKLTASLYNGIFVEKLEGKDVDKVLRLGCSILQKNGFDYWLTAGTLLGLHREGRFLPHDGDLDVDIGFDEPLYNDHSMNDFKRIIELFEKEGMKIGRTMFYDAVNPMQAAFIGEGNIVYDIYFYYLYGDDYVNINEHGLIKFPKNIIKKTKLREFNGTNYSIPCKQEEYIAMRYGKGWRTPKKGGLSTNVDEWKDGKIAWDLND